MKILNLESLGLFFSHENDNADGITTYQTYASNKSFYSFGFVTLVVCYKNNDFHIAHLVTSTDNNPPICTNHYIFSEEDIMDILLTRKYPPAVLLNRNNNLDIILSII